MQQGTIAPPTPAKHHRFHLLDALRGIAAIFVVPRHMPQVVSHPFNFYGSFLAVDFFFCLSGFVVAFSYEQRMQGQMTFRQFALTRLVRLYPLAFLGTFIGLLSYLPTMGRFYDMPVSLAGLPWLIASGFLFIPFPFLKNGALFPLDGVLWTLFFELIANLVYGALVRRKWAGSTTLGIIALASFAVLTQQTISHGTADLGFAINIAIAGLARVGFAFFAGVLLHRFFRRQHVTRWHGKRAVGGAVIVTALFSAIMLMRKTGHPALQDLIAICALPVLVYAGACIALPETWTSACVFLGAISYPLYVLHVPISQALHIAPVLNFAQHHGAAADRAMTIGWLAILILAAWIADRFYDSPVRRWWTARLSAHLKPTTVSKAGASV